MEVPLLLNANNVEDYFRQTVLPHLALGTEVMSSREITENTFVNWVFAIQVLFIGSEAPETVYVRQSRDYVKKYENMPRDSRRVETEARVLAYLNGIVPGTVPEVINLDTANSTLTLTDIKKDGNLLTDELANGRVHEQAGTAFGKTIGRIQATTFGRSFDDILGPDLPHRPAISMASYLGPRTKVAEQLFPDLTADILRASDAAPRSLLLGDLASKNIFVENDDMRFLDLERVTVGDPAYDPAYLFCHYLIEVPLETMEKSVQFISNFMNSYLSEMSPKLNAEELNKLQNRIVRLLGMSLIHRTQGSHFVTYDGPNKDFWQVRAKRFMEDIKSTSVVDAMKTIDQD